MEQKRNSNAIALAITDDLLRVTGQSDLALVAASLGLDPVGADMGRITGLSRAALSRANRGQSQTRAWRHLASLTALVRELAALMEGTGGAGLLEPEATRRWLYAGQITLAGQIYRPIDVLSDEQLTVALLAELRQANRDGVR